MPIRTTTRAVAECDTCGGQLDPVEHDGTLWPEEAVAAAENEARDAGWTVTRDHHVHCPDHASTENR